VGLPPGSAGLAVASGLAGERRAVLQRIVLGEDQDLSPHLGTSFRASGLYHLFSVDRLGDRADSQRDDM
jgi:predicted membrane metal-binding protein